jgi:PAS domain-containing protein
MLVDSPACYDDLAMEDRKHLEPPTEEADRIIYEFNLDTGELRWSDSLRTLLGHDPAAEPTNTHEWWANHVHTGDAMALNEVLDMLMYPWVKEWTIDYRFEKADHSFVLVHDRATVTRDGNGKAVQLSGIIWLAS